LAGNLYGRTARNLEDAVKGANGIKQVLNRGNKLNYQLFGRLIQTINQAIEKPEHQGITSSDLAWEIHNQLRNLLTDYYSKNPVKQTLNPIHPRSYLIQRMIDLWFILPITDLSKDSQWMRMSIENPYTATTTLNASDNAAFWFLSVFQESRVHAGPFYHQPMP